jgi:hypothetical protein
VDFGLLVLEGDIEAHDVAVVELGGHVGVTTTVIENETTDKFGLGGHLVLHVHDLDHVQVKRLVGSLDGLDGIDDNFGQGVSEIGVNFGVEGGGGYFQKEVAGNFLLDLEIFEESEDFTLGQFDTIDNNAGVDTFSEVSLSLSHELSSEEDVGGSTITSDVILSGSCTTDHSGSRVLDLHLVEEDSSVLGELDLTGTTNKPIKFERAINNLEIRIF